MAALSCVQLLTVEFLDQVSGVHDADAVGEVGDFGKDVTGHEDGDAVLGRQRLEQLADLHDAGRIESVRWLVQDEQLRAVQQRPGQCEPLFEAE